MNSIFSVTVFDFADDKFDRKCQIDLYSQKLGFFSSLNDAEKMILDFAEMNRRCIRKSNIAYFEVREFALNPNLDPQTHGVCEWESIRTYDSNGKIHCESLLDADCMNEFDGRTEPCQFKHGDIVLYMSHSKAFALIVDIPSYTKEEWKQKFKPGVKGDWTDDCYLAYDAFNDHHHVFVPYVFSCQFNLSRHMIKKLNAVLKDNQQEV